MPSPTRSSLDRHVGMLYYISEHEGIGGVLREGLEDFRVIEIALGGVLCTPGCSQLLRGSGDYVWFLMEKRGVDTVTALRAVARAMGVSHKKFTVAGLKDARAVTFQMVCAEGIDPQALPRRVGERIIIHDVFTMPFKLQTGMLEGNFFEITVRRLGVSASDAEARIKRILEEVEGAGGVPNYYGYQRFGTIRPLTHIVGRLILQRRFEEAVREILTRVFPHESPRAKEARLYLESTWDVEGALKLFPKRLHHERMMLHYLLKHPRDYFGAIRTLPYSVRRLFIEAYQAYLFNRVLSKRIEMGLPISLPVVGDIVALGGERGAIIRARNSNLSKLRELVSQGKARVVGNVFGYASVLAEGTPGAIEREVLEEEGISLDAFMVKHAPELSSKGALRPLSMRVKGLEWSVLDGERPCAVFKFALERGAYATVLIREIIKPEDPALQGF